MEIYEQSVEQNPRRFTYKFPNGAGAIVRDVSKIVDLEHFGQTVEIHYFITFFSWCYRSPEPDDLTDEIEVIGENCGKLLDYVSELPPPAGME